MTTATASITPERSLAQRLDALQRANDIRTRRAVLKRRLKFGDIDARRLILNPPQYVQTMKLWDLLLAVPKLGRTKVNRILIRCGVSPSKTLGGLSERQRREITQTL